MRSDTTQKDMFRNRAPTAADYLAAAEVARRNPFETPEASERRAQHYEAMASQIQPSPAG